MNLKRSGEELGPSSQHKAEVMNKLILIIIDGLRRDVFLRELDAGKLPNIARIVGGRESTTACHIDAVSTAPSSTMVINLSHRISRVTGSYSCIICPSLYLIGLLKVTMAFK